MFRRADALAVGGYDEAFAPVWFDDIDLSLSICGLGRKVLYTPAVRVVHHRHQRVTRGSLARGRAERARSALAD